MTASHEVAQRFGSELFTIDGAVGAGAHPRGDFGIDGGEDRSPQLGMEHTGHMVHPGRVDPP